jgi:hypothetical protein
VDKSSRSPFFVDGLVGWVFASMLARSSASGVVVSPRFVSRPWMRLAVAVCRSRLAGPAALVGVLDELLFDVESGSQPRGVLAGGDELGAGQVEVALAWAFGRETQAVAEFEFGFEEVGLEPVHGLVGQDTGFHLERTAIMLLAECGADNERVPHRRPPWPAGLVSARATTPPPARTDSAGPDTAPLPCAPH